MPQATFVGVGELLWDLLPESKQLGGAPSNFAYISSLLGNRGIVVSRLGNDELGLTARDRCNDLVLDVSHLQFDPEHPTGTVNVKLEDGHPSFVINRDVAWDYLQWDAGLEHLAREADVVCFGSLAQRSETARTTIQRFVRATRESCLRIFDVNLRQSFYNGNILKTGFALATVTKLNNDELPIVLRSVGLPSSDEPRADCRTLIEHFGLELVCYTRGPHGSLLVSREHTAEHPGFRVTVADTVGSGDAFTAAMAHQLRRGASLDQVNEFANRMGSWVASQPGATPPSSEAFQGHLRDWTASLASR